MATALALVVIEESNLVALAMASLLAKEFPVGLHLLVDQFQNLLAMSRIEVIG